MSTSSELRNRLDRGRRLPLEFNSSTEKDAESVYHVLILCPEAMKIREEHHEYVSPAKCVGTKFWNGGSVRAELLRHLLTRHWLKRRTPSAG